MNSDTDSIRRVNLIRRRAYEALEVGRGDDRISQALDLCLIGLIVLNAIAFIVETIPSVEASYGPHLDLFNLFSVIVFTIEYGLRVWSCVEMPFLRRMPAWKARLHFARRPYLIIDLLAVLPFYLAFVLPIDLRVLRVLRLIRLAKLARYSPALNAIVEVFHRESRTLLGALLLMTIVLLLSASGMHLLEKDAQPDAFGTIPDAAWWAMATLTTVGYGDVSPVTPFGKLFGGLVMLLGLGMFALPIAIIATGFAQEVGRRDFVVTWPLIARIPLLAELDTGQVLTLMPHLSSHNYPPHWDVVSAGDVAASMYFIASGKVRIRTDAGDTELGTGDFFGEVEMLEGVRYQFSFTTTTRVRLLELGRAEFFRLENANPELGERIRTIAKARAEARAAGRPEPHAIQVRDGESGAG
ncbi:MAG: ion transporter [Gammaproteobacteria bacterium]|nr:ion transporter [Gammaproteobacteria bacterium]